MRGVTWQMAKCGCPSGATVRRSPDFKSSSRHGATGRVRAEASRGLNHEITTLAFRAADSPGYQPRIQASSEPGMISSLVSSTHLRRWPWMREVWRRQEMSAR